MKKALILGLIAAMLLALVLAACNKPQADQPTEPDPTQAVTSTPEPEQTPEPVTTPEPPEQIPAAPAQLSSTTQADPDEADPSQPPEETAPQEPVEEVKLFDDVNETVYATGTVNIRASWTANSEKLGSMGTGESVTRTGTPIAGTEAEGWSRVCLADGTIAYISTSYLSTTKPQTQTQAPATNTNNQGGGTTQTQQPSNPGGGGTQQAPATGTTQATNKDNWDDEVYAMLTPEQKAVYESADGSTRAYFNRSIKDEAILKSQGWTTEWHTSTGEELAEQWSHIRME